MKTPSIFPLIFVMVAMGCGELVPPNSKSFVVEAFITADETVTDIKIKETASLDVESPPDIPITTAEVMLVSEELELLLSYDEATGKYVDAGKDFSVSNFGQYSIEIVVDGIRATSSTVVPEKPTGLNLSDSVLIVPPLSLSFQLPEQIQRLFNEERSTLTWDSEPGRSYFVVIETQEEEIDAILPPEIPEESTELLQSFRFISEPSEQNSFDIIAIALETYGKHVAKVYTVNEEYVELFNSATQDSRDLNEPPTNIRGALGIFTAFAVDSLEFELRRE
jgi:hypothetical protein